jgi:HK97 family phage major capsid protein
MATKIEELRDELAAKQKTISEVFDQAGEDLDMSKVEVLEGDSHEKVKQIREMNTELESIFDQIKDEQVKEAAAKLNLEVEEYLKRPVSRPDAPPGEEFKSYGQMIVESDALAGFKGGNQGPTATFPEWDLKTLMSTGAGWAPETVRGPRFVEEVTRPIQLLDLFPTTNTDQTSIVFMEETTFTNAAAEVAESVQGTPGTFPESALALTEQSSPVRKIATWLPVSDEQLEDVNQVTGYINNRLPFMLRQRLDGQVINGDGIAPNLDGILNVAGIQTYALSAEPVFDAVHKGITLVNVTGRASADAIVMHSNDWQDLRLTRTADGIYILGNPSEVGQPRLWGLPVVLNEAIAENTALVGDFGGYSELSFKRGVDIQVSNSHSTFFIEGTQAMRADLRVALVVYRPAAFCTVTGI